MFNLPCVHLNLQTVSKCHIKEWLEHPLIHPNNISIIFNSISNPPKFLPQIRYKQLFTKFPQNNKKQQNLIQDSKTNCTSHFLKTLNNQLRSSIALLMMI